jgi:hypothetical protein
VFARAYILKSTTDDAYIPGIFRPHKAKDRLRKYERRYSVFVCAASPMRGGLSTAYLVYAGDCTV